MRSLRVSLPLLLVSSILLAPFAFGQWNGVLDPGECYSQLLQKTDIYSHNETLKLALLSTITEDNFESFKANSSITAIYSGIPFTAGWGAFKEARRRYFEQHQLNVDYATATATSSIGLDPQASHIFDSCIYAKALAGNYGLSAFGSPEDETTATVQLFWKPTHVGENITITDSSVDNATVVGGDAYPGKLFPPKYSFGDSKTRTLKRGDPTKPIIITLDTDVRATPIRIKEVPPLTSCQLKAFDADPDSGAAFVWHGVPWADDYLQPYDRGSRGQAFAITHPVDGTVTYVHCHLTDPSFIHLDGDSEEGQGVGTSIAICAGAKNGDRRNVTMDVRWQKKLMVCTPIPWKTKEQQEADKKKMQQEKDKNKIEIKPTFTDMQ